MTDFTLKGKAVIGNDVIDNAAIAVSNGKIIYAGADTSAPVCGEEIIVSGTILPGFIDIHCHSAKSVSFYEEPKYCADYHLEHGTTTMCATLYRSLGFDGLMKAIDLISDVMPDCKNLYGIHLEGPYLNPIYGSMSDGIEIVAKREDYLPLIDNPNVKHVTYAPEVEGTDLFLSDILERGIVAAIGHSAASPEDVHRAAMNGATNVTHLFDATGASIIPARWAGTIETDFNAACLLEDNFYYEIINDKNGVHVRHEMTKLVKKTVGVDRIIGITDSSGSEEHDDDVDVSIEQGELCGSRMTMNNVAKNFYNLGFTMPEVVKVTAVNAAKLMGIYDKVGSLEEGKTANIVVVDDNFDVEKVFIF